jgi:iron complex outermembrane receptor protein
VPLTHAPRSPGKDTLLSLLLGCCIGSFSMGRPGWAQPAGTLPADIAPQSLSGALAAFANQTGLQLIYVSELAKNRGSKGARAGVPVSEAMNELLSDTGLQFQFLNPRTVRVFAVPITLPDLATQPLPRPRTLPERADISESTSLREIVVTSSQREEALGRVPISLAVWTESHLETAGVKDMQTLAALTPGVEIDEYTDLGPGIQTNIAIRGINAKDGSTTGIYLDDTPIPTDRTSAFGRIFPNTFDLERVEILRGPQGTLAGEGAEGGAVRFVTKQPNLTSFDGFARAEFAMTERGAPSYAVGGAAGGPVIADRLGFRLAASTERPGGFIDRVSPFTGAIVDANANSERRETVRAAFAFAAGDSIRITPAYYYSSSVVNDTPAFYTYLSDPGQGILRNGKLLQQWATERYYVPSLTIAATIPLAEIVSTTAYLDRSAEAFIDSTNISAWHWPNPLGPEYPVSYTNARPGVDTLGQINVSEELRVTSADPEARLAWIAGTSYLHGHATEFQPIVGASLSDGGTVNGHANARRITEQWGGFAQLTFRISDRLSAIAGLRAEHARYNSNTDLGLIAGGGGQFEQVFHTTGGSVPIAPRFILSYQADEQSLFYSSLAKGYRMGGPNAQVGASCPSPASYGPDSVWSIELGSKMNLLDRRLRLDSSLFRAKWREQQTAISLPQCGFGYTTNAGAAISQGFDLGIQALLTDRLSTFLTVAYVDAHYSQSVFSNNAVIVDRGDAIGALPLVPAPWTVTASTDYRFTLGSQLTINLHAQDAFHSRNPGPFTSQNRNAVTYDPTRTPDPSTNQLDLRMTTSWRRFDVAAFVNNVLDAQPILQRRNYNAFDTLYYATTFRPRTVGLVITWRL